MIIGVTVKRGDITVSLPKPNRHHDCIYYAHFTLGITLPTNNKLSEQGFYLADGTFLNRVDALKYAKKNNQLINQQAHTQLYSEDLW